MAEDTAVLEPDTAAVDPTPPPDEAPETEAYAPETEALEETPETEEPDPFEGKTAAEIKQLIEDARKDAESRARESERRKWESKEQEREAELRRAAFEVKRTQASRDRQGAYERDLYAVIGGAVKQALTDGEERYPSQQTVQQLAARVEAAVALEQYLAVAEFQDSLIAANFPDYRPSQEVVKALEAATIAQDAEKLHTARFHQLQEAVREKLRAEVRAEVEAELKAEAEKQAKTKGAQDGAAARAGGPVAVNGGGTAGVRIGSMSEADKAYLDGRITHTQYKQFRAKYEIKD